MVRRDIHTMHHPGRFSADVVRPPWPTRSWIGSQTASQWSERIQYSLAWCPCKAGGWAGGICVRQAWNYIYSGRNMDYVCGRLFYLLYPARCCFNPLKQQEPSGSTSARNNSVVTFLGQPCPEFSRTRISVQHCLQKQSFWSWPPAIEILPFPPQSCNDCGQMHSHPSCAWWSTIHQKVGATAKHTRNTCHLPLWLTPWICAFASGTLMS